MKSKQVSRNPRLGPIICWVCGEEVRNTNIKYKHFMECSGCGSLLRLDGIGVEYTDSYYGRGRVNGFLGKVVKWFAFWDRIRFLNLKNDNELLEVGFGSGEFIIELKIRGYKSAGAEVSPYAIKEASKVLGKENVFDTNYLKKTNRKFDYVVMFHVLEHVDNPVNLVKMLRSKLKPGGKIVVRVPNLNSSEARMAGRDWYHLDYPYHRSVFTDKGLVILLKKAGFENIICRYDLGEYRQVMGDILLKKIGLKRVNKYIWAVVQSFTLPLYWIWSKVFSDFGVVEAQAK